MQNGCLIANLRIKADLTQKDMATLLNVSEEAYRLYESNLRPMQIYELNFISNYFKVSLDTLLHLEHDENLAITSERIDYRYLKFKLKLIRKSNKLKQKDLANDFNLSVSTISRFENKPQFVSINYLYMFAKKFNVSVDYLCGKTAKKEVFNLS